LEEEAQRKQKEEEMQQREEKYQRDLAHWLEVDYTAAVEQQCHKNWTNTFLFLLNPPSNEEMNLIDLPSLTKRQYVYYLPKETPEAHQQHEELTKEMGMVAIGRGSLCERCIDIGILCISQNLLWVFI